MLRRHATGAAPPARLALMFMARRGDRERAAKRVRAEMSKVPEVELYEAPAGAVEVRYNVGLMCGCQVSQRLLNVHHSLVFFAIVWSQRTTFGGWVERYSVDSGHGYYHEHVSGHQEPDDRRDLRPLYSQVDVQECFDPGYDRVQDRHDRDCRGGAI